MSGRLSKLYNKRIQEFPVLSWQSEFNKATNCGFDTIEWIFDHNPNPIMHEDGIQEIKKLSRDTGVDVISLIADYFMDKMLFNVAQEELEQNVSILEKLIQQCYKLGIEILEMPFVDSSSLKTETDRNQIVRNLESIVDYAYAQNVKITLETDLPPIEFKKLLEKFSIHIGANYDTGNSASLGYDAKEEIEVLIPWLTNVHIKDRMRMGDTVPLGSGDTNFDKVFSTLSSVSYTGQLIIQGAREDQEGAKPEETCKKYLEFVKQYTTKYNLFSSNSVDI